MEENKAKKQTESLRSTKSRDQNLGENTIRRGIWLSSEMYNTILNLASEKHVNSSIIIRQLLAEALNYNYLNAQEDKIRKYIREEIEIVLDKQIDRIIKLQLKATKASASSLFAITTLLQNDQMSEVGLETLLANAFKAAAGYMHTKEKTNDEYCEEAREMLKENISRKVDT